MSRAFLVRWGLVLLRIALGAVFIYAGLAKMRRPAWEFEASVASFRLMPDAWIGLFAASLPFFEVLAGFWLLIGWRSRTAAFVLVVLNLGLLVALGQAGVRGLDVSCGCFGAGSNDGPWGAIKRDLVLLGMAVALYWGAHRPEAARVGGGG